MQIDARQLEIPVFDQKELLPYTVGALLYSPAVNQKIPEMIQKTKYGTQFSLSLCLEDAVSDTSLNHAEEQLHITLQKLYMLSMQQPELFMPKLFIRIREPGQLLPLFLKIKAYEKLITGFIFPKYTICNADESVKYLNIVSQYASRRIYMMPILESTDIINPAVRALRLNEIKEQLLPHKDSVLNVRVGGNDFCKSFGVRRPDTSTIYEIAAVSNILGDIISVFADSFIVSGPVNEYFDKGDWRQNFIRETKQDLINGFIGKTVIHPKQIALVNEAYQPSFHDYQDALRILGWQEGIPAVEKSFDGSRMNETKTHQKWADKILKLSYVYGVKTKNDV